MYNFVRKIILHLKLGKFSTKKENNSKVLTHAYTRPPWQVYLQDDRTPWITIHITNQTPPMVVVRH